MLTLAFIADHGFQIYVLHAAKNVFLNVRTLFPQFADQRLDLRTLAPLLGTPAARTVLGKAACALNKMKVIVAGPVYDILFAHQIERADQLHPLKIRTVQLRHHRLHLSSVKHAHQNRLYDIIKVMPQRNLI